MTYECGDCGRADWTSISAMIQCPCQNRTDSDDDRDEENRGYN